MELYGFCEGTQARYLSSVRYTGNAVWERAAGSVFAWLHLLFIAVWPEVILRGSESVYTVQLWLGRALPLFAFGSFLWEVFP